MIKKYWQAVINLLIAFQFCLFAPIAHALVIDKIVIFGDSMSDNGNLYTLSSSAAKVIPLVPVVPKDPPYFKGRFSNGPIWVENLAKAMNVQLADYAYGGAWVESVWDSMQLVPFDLNTQINFYLVTAATDYNKDQHLYVIWAGGNDYTDNRKDHEYATTNTISLIQKQIDWLIYYGAKHFLILNLPDLGRVPEVRDKGPEFAADVSHLTELHNQKLRAMLDAEQAKHPDLQFIMVDITSHFDEIINHPDEYHLKNVSKACYGGDYEFSLKMANLRELDAAKKANINIMSNASLREAYLASKLSALDIQPCDNPDEYFFWDHIHPTRVAHQVLAVLIQTELAAHDIKGPSARA